MKEVQVGRRREGCLLQLADLHAAEGLTKAEVEFFSFGKKPTLSQDGCHHLTKKFFETLKERGKTKRVRVEKGKKKNFQTD